MDGVKTGNSPFLGELPVPTESPGARLLGVAVRHVTHPWMLPKLNHSLGSAFCALCVGSFHVFA